MLSVCQENIFQSEVQEACSCSWTGGERMRRRCLVCLLGDKKARIDQSIFKGLIWIIVLILKIERNIFISYDIACSHL